MALGIIEYAASKGELRARYDQMLARPLPPLYRAADGGLPRIIAAHGFDPPLIERVFGYEATVEQAGPLSWPERELIDALTARVDQCGYRIASQARLVRAALDDDALARAILASPRTIAKAAPTARMRMIAELTTLVAEAPWSLRRQHLTRAHSAGLGDEDVLHVITLAAYFGHLDRIATAVGLDDSIADVDNDAAWQGPDETAPPWPAAPTLVSGRPAIELARRPETATAIAEWRNYMFDRDEPISRRHRTLIVRLVASWLGDGSISSPGDLTMNPLDDPLREVAELVTLAPWQLDEDSFEGLRDAGFDDVDIFDVCATATSAGMFSRIEVALAALAM